MTDSAEPSIGFVGLGIMGGPMAGHLLSAGRRVTVWNRTPEKASALRDAGAAVAPSLGELGAGCDVVISCVSRSEDVWDCVSALRETAKPGTLFIDHSTIAPLAAEEIAESLGEGGFRFVDAPITGGSMGAKAGTLTIFLGGSETDVEEALAIVKPYAKRAERVGPSGAGQWMKMANQIAVGGALSGLCESLNFAQKAGLSVAQAKELIGAGAGGSWAFEFYGPKILAADWSPGFTVTNQRKDFGYCAEAARTVGAAIPCTMLLDEMLAELEAAGHGEWTTAALYALLQEKKG
jgi:3-hydroxyisobutyrate dehydrogenase-like beta-hydroxyacid dehydrogenase